MTKRSHARTALAKIRLEISRMPAAQARVGEVFLEHPEEAIRASVADLAGQARCGEASVIRFCRTIGFDNLRDLRVALAAETAYRQGDAPSSEVDQVDRLYTALRSTADRLDRNVLRRVAVAMKAAPHIDVFGSGVSGMGAHLFAYRFSRIGLVARAWSDEVVADEILPSRQAGSVAMIVSETGLTLRTENFLKKSRQAGAFTVAVCGQSAHALEPLCNEVLAVTPLDPLPERGEMAPLLGKLLLCDRIAAEVLAIVREGFASK